MSEFFALHIPGASFSILSLEIFDFLVIVQSKLVYAYMMDSTTYMGAITPGNSKKFNPECMFTNKLSPWRDIHAFVSL